MPYSILMRAVLTLTLVMLPLLASAQVSNRGQLKRGIAELKSGKIEAAREIFAEVLAGAPNWSLAQLNFGIAELRLSPNSPAALTALERAVQLAPENPRARYFVGVAYQNHQRYPEAIKALSRCLELRPRFKDADFRLATSLETTGDDVAAVAAYRLVLARDKKHVGTLAALARLYEKRREPHLAEEALQAIARAHPDVAYHQYQLARFYERIGEADKAARATARAEKIDPRPQRRMRELKRSRR